MTTNDKARNPSADKFPGRIGRKSAVIFGILLSLVLLVGGSSLYLLRFVLLGLEEIEKESEQVELAQNIHRTIQEVISTYVGADLEQRTLSDYYRKALFSKLTFDLRRLREEAVRHETIAEVGEVVANIASISERTVQRARNSTRLPRRNSDLADLNALRVAERRIEAIARVLSAAHEIHEQQELVKDHGVLENMVGVYLAFVILGVFLILGANFMVSRLMSRPLRSLARCAGEIAQDRFDSKVPISSNDEIGQLSHTFNLMLDRLRENKERLKGIATLEERGRIAQELHDSVAQDLALLHLELIKAERSLRIAKTADAKKMIREIRAIVDRAYDSVRESIFGLRVTGSEDLDLVPALAQYLHRMSEIKGIPVDLVIPNPEEVQLALHAEIQLVRIIQEALANIFKHAQATRSAVRFERDDDFVKIIIEDDGRGFAVDRAMEKNLHFGLQTMRERAEGVSGKLNIESAPGRGTRVIVRLPLEEKVYETYPLAVSR